MRDVRSGVGQESDVVEEVGNQVQPDLIDEQPAFERQAVESQPVLEPVGEPFGRGAAADARRSMWSASAAGMAAAIRC